MKKSIRIAALVLAALCLTGCNKKEVTTDDTEPIDTSYDPAEYVELCDYKNITFSDDEVTVSDADVMDYLRSEMDKYTETEEITDRGAEMGDIVSLNIHGFIDGKELETLKTYYFEIRLGEATLGIDFEQNLVGVKTGESTIFDISYPEDYPSDNLAGKTVEYQVKVNYILKYTEYELNDENMEMLSDGLYTTVEEAKADASEFMLLEDFQTYKDKYILRRVIEDSTVKDYPENLLTVYEADMVANYSTEAVNAGYTDFETYLDEQYGMTMDEFSQYVDTYCKEAIREEMIYTLIAEKENITLTDEEYENYVSYFASAYQDTYYYSMTPDEFAESLGEENIRQALTIRKTQEAIIGWNS